MRLLAALAVSAPLLSFASSTTPDYTDLWFNASESGWGANVVQQGGTMFVTFFVYGSNNQPTWYVASAATQQGGATSGTFSGTLYQTTGPWFGGAFNPSAVGVTQVGTMTFTATGVSAATLSYTVNGVAVSKNVVRQTFAGDDIAGTYNGASLGNWFSCPFTGYIESTANFTVTQDQTSVTMREEGTSSNYTCTYTAQYGASGRLGTLAGNGICSDGVNFSFTASEVAVSRDALSMRIDLTQINGCHFQGRMGGIRKGSL